MINILYNDLKTLITNNQLVPEEQYRITDYVTTVSKANYTSAGYKFDIVVTALTTNTLYEYATLMANATETYFDADALLLYNIKYNVNNIIPGYYNDWVDVNGKGCIYYMVDDKGNEAPFDFKNIKHNGKFLFNNTLDGTDTSQTVSEYNVVKEVIEDGYFKLPQISFNDACSGCTIGTNADQLIITESSNLQIGDNCKNSEFTNVDNTLIGNELSDATLTSIDGAEIGDNNNGIIATNQTNLIIKDNNTSIELGGGNGVIIDSNNTNVTIGTNAKDIYINGSKTINLGNNIEQFNISSCYDVVVADDCKLFTLHNTNHLTSELNCNSITCNDNEYVTIINKIENIYVAEGIDNIILDGSQIDFSEYKTLTIDDVNYIVTNDSTGESWILNSDGTLSANPSGKLVDSPSDGFVYGRKDGNWEQIDTSGDYEVTYDDVVNALTYVPISTDQLGVANGLAMLDAQGYVLNAQLPSYVDDIIEVDTFTLLPVTGEKGKIYIVTDSGKTYRWATTQYVTISESLTLGTGSEQAYPGNLGAALRIDVDGKANTSHTHTKSEVGLANVDNTSDVNKPISNATQTALNSKANTSHTHTKSEVGLANVDNTSDLTKPISTATQTALNSKANTVHTHTKSEVGLSNVDNTSDANKPISNATQGALDGKLPMKGKATTNLQVGQSFYNILNFMVPATENTQRELTINTKIPFSDVYSSGTITISGIAYYKQSPFELTISYRIYGGEVYMPASGVIISGPWQPVVKWFNRGGFLCLAFIDADPMNQMSMKIDVFNKSTSAANYMDGWTWASTTGIGDATNIPGSAVVLPLKITQITNAQLPGRLQEQALRITDWNTATTNGFYQSGPAATNVPVVDKYILGQVWNHDTTGNCTQEVHVFVGDGPTDTQSYRRDMNGGTWGAWYKVLKSQEEIVAAIRATNVSESQLPERLRTTARRIYNWNTITETGWYQSYSNGEDERVAANAPIAGWLFGHVVAHISAPASAYCTQEVWQFSSGIGMKWKRTIRNGVPDANWIQVYETSSELNSVSLPLLGKPGGELQLGRNYYNVASFVSGGGAAVNEVVIYTRLPYNSSAMPVIKINGYCYVAGSGRASNIDLQIMYYVAGGNIVNDSVVSNGTFTPTVKLFKHTVSGTDYIAVGLQGLISYLQFTVDYQNHWSAINQSAGWTVASQNGGTSLIEGQPNLKTIRYNLDNKTDINAVKNTISITYTALKNLRDSGTLVPGQSYRITDYVCTTVTTNTRSAGNQFDIIVTALSTNKLSENASATYHTGDTYFSSNNANLEAWKLKYCIDNDTSRFEWADTASGKGVIYYMKDNYNNELPYDFKNIQYFKNNVWVYTFGGTVDNSLVATCSNNKINIYISSNKQTLNNITFGTDCFSNTFGINCYSNTFGDNCYYNIFDVNCYSNTFGNTCHSNTFGTNCYSNTFGNSCVYNTFGDNCYSNTFGDSCGTNNFGDNCQSNTFGAECQSNTFGYDCYYNIFGVECYSNTFGNVCLSNTFGNSCRSNTFGNECRSNKFYDGTIGSTTPKNYIRYIVLENGVRFNNFYSNVTTNGSSWLQRIRIKGLENVIPTSTIITLSAVNTKYEWVVCYTSGNVLKQYCIEDAPSDDKTYGRKNGNWSEIVTSGGGGSTIPITWSALKALRDAGTLVPGQSYRIVNYTTTTSQANTSAAGNDFDVIVVALDESTLSENASAIQRDGTTYFNGRLLSSWQIKYCLDNDTTKFAWTNTSTGKGVIYYMKDEHNNECPYDFKNIKFTKDSTSIYTFGGTTDSTNQIAPIVYNNTIKPYIFNNKYELGFNTFGTMCRNNYLDFNCKNNTFGTLCYNNFFGVGCESNTLGEQSSNNTFESECKRNTTNESFTLNYIGRKCLDNTFGIGCSKNKFGVMCSNNTFANNCNTNTLNSACSNIQFGDWCETNTFGNNCTNNKFGTECFGNVFGEWCATNTFGNLCYNITFNAACNNNKFGSSCTYITFRHNCHHNELGSACNNILYEASCKYNYFYNGTIANPGTIKNYLLNITLEQASSYNNFYSDTITNNSQARLQMIRIRVSGTQIGALMLNTQITNTTLNRTNELLIARNSAGVVKQYCLEDLIP